MDYELDLNLGDEDFRLKQSLDLGSPLTSWMTDVSINYVLSMLWAEKDLPGVSGDIRESLSPSVLMSDIWLTHILTSKELPNWGVTHRPFSATIVGSKFGQLVNFWQHSLTHLSQFNFPVYLSEPDYTRATIARTNLKTDTFKSIFVLTDSVYLWQQPSQHGHVVVWKNVQELNVDRVLLWNKCLPKGTIVVLHGRTFGDAESQLTSVSDLDRYFHEGQTLYAGQLNGKTETQFALAIKT